MEKDLTRGKPLKVIWRFSMPLLLSMAFQQIYNAADSIIVGWFIGPNALASIGAAYPITLIYIAICTGLSMGVSVIIGHYYGARETRVMKTAINTATIALCVFGVVVSLGGMLLAGPLMRLLGTPPLIIEDAIGYLQVYSLGVLAMAVYNGANAIYTGLGDSKRPLYFLIISSLLNIVLDLVFIGVFHMGVVNAAWATAISQYVAAIMASIVLFRHLKKIKTDEKPKRFDKGLLANMGRLSLPAVFQQSSIALSHTLIQSIVNGYSESFIAGYEIASKIHNFAYMCFNTIGTALSSFVAQNFGAGKKDRIRQGFRISSTMCFALSAIVVLIMQLFAPELIGLFVNAAENPEVIEAGSKYLRMISPAYLVISFIITSGGLLRGVGRVKDFFLLTVFDLGIRVIMSFVLTSYLDSYTGLFWAWYFGSIPDVIICFWLYRRMLKPNGVLADVPEQM